jgi:putative ABC transport system permease protein
MWRATLKGIAAHKLRLVLTAISVVVAVSFISGTYVLTDTVKGTFSSLFSDLNRGVDLRVAATTGFGNGDDAAPMPAAVADQVAAVDGVSYAEGSVLYFFGDVRTADGERVSRASAPTIITNANGHPELSAFSYREGRAPTAPDEVAIDVSSADRAHLQVGDTITVTGAGAPVPVHVVGLLGFGDADDLAGATVTVFAPATAQQLADRVGQWDAVQAKVEPGADRDIVLARVQESLDANAPGRYQVITGEANARRQTADVGKVVDTVNRFLLAFGFIALFVGAYIIVNTFSIIVSQRQRELALLRALGASGWQVLVSVVAESLAVGLVASALGLLAGIGIAALLKALLAAGGLDAPAGALTILPRTVLVAFATGTLVTVAAALAPALRAARVAPLAAIRETEAAAVRQPRVRTVVGAALGLLGLASMGLGLADVGPIRHLVEIAAGAGLVLLGVSLLAALVARPGASAIGAPLPRLRGVQGVLARQNSMRSARRTASTASALMIGLSLVTVVLILAASLTRTVNRIVDDTFLADLSVRADQVQPFSPSLGDRLAQLPEVGMVGRYRFDSWQVGRDPQDERKAAVDGVDPAAIDVVYRLDVRDFDPQAFAAGGVVVSADEAADRGIHVGDQLAVTYASTGHAVVPVVGIYHQRGFTSAYVLALDTFRRNFPQLDVDALLFLKAAPGVSVDRLRTAVAGVVSADYPDLHVEDRAEYQQAQRDQVDQVLFIFIAMLFFSVIIAVIGVTNTLALSIFERTREIGLLRAVGMVRGQLRSMVRWEAVIMAIFGALLGLVLGTFFGYALVQAFGPLGFVLDFVVPPTIFVVIVAAFVLGLIAAVFPARRAARLDVLAAIATD